MKTNEIIRDLREQGISLWCEKGKIRYFKKDGKLEEAMKEILIENKNEVIKYLEEDNERYDSFPLTDIQMAYLLGRKGAFEYGDIASHLYLELEYPDLDSVRVQMIWNQLITEHDMLRAVVFQNGTQKVLPKVDEYHIYVSNDVEERGEIRSKWANKFYETERWPLFDIGITNGKEKDILHLSFDFLIADWASIWKLLREFEIKYYGKIDNSESCPISFRNYILNENGMRKSQKYIKDKKYWTDRLKTIPEAPVLPTISDMKQVNQFIRKAQKLDSHEWGNIKEFSMKNGITPTATVLAIFAMCIERWSENKKFALNLTTLARNSKYPNIYNVIGDFTNVNILEINLSESISFTEFAKKVNKQLFEDLDHNSYSGVEVMRDLRKSKKDSTLFYPIIFTSSIGLVDLENMIGRINDNGISQTPQAFLDCQVMDSREGLFINWDIREGIFEEGVIQDVFEMFIRSLRKFSESFQTWSEEACVSLPTHQLIKRECINNTTKKIKSDTLQNLFINSALKMPYKTAVVDERGEYTYEKLLWTAYGVAGELQKRGCKRGDYVGIKLNKGFFQIASVLGTLFTGAAFIPIDNEQPESRANKIMETAKLLYLIGEKEEIEKYKEKYECIEEEKIHIQKSYGTPVLGNFSDVAYVIFTSGSTGEPKGVVIEQEAIVNTIVDINERFSINANDRIFAISQLHFDLSIYDVFGMLAAGGTIIIPGRDRYKDPSYWLTLVEKWGITVWNSVPAFLDMFVDYLERFYKGEKLSVNKILLSGDWIPIKLPARIRNFLGNVQIYSLGGATEASIWSIFYECKDNDVYNNSIPYGVPLNNQGFKILDISMRECPDMVQGELYITGKGLAKEYLGDTKKTQDSFIEFNNERVYKTGDFGRYLPNGEIEFLGRKDSQIKISGHRIDTGEIENVLMDCCSSKSCCVTTIDWHNEKKIVAVIVPKAGGQWDEVCIREALKQHLPQYMIPFSFEFVDEIPRTNNGKIDKKAIQRMFIDKRNRKEQYHNWNLNDLIEKEVNSVLRKTLNIEKLCPNDNLFDMGADSLLMAQIAGKIKETIEDTSVTFDEILRQILNNPTGEALVDFIKRKKEISTSESVIIDNVIVSNQNSKDTVYVFFHAALGTTNCYRFIEKQMRKDNLGDLLFINIENADMYCSIQCDELVEKITDKYAEHIGNLNYKHINFVGYCLGGILALNVAVKLLEQGMEINNLYILDSYPVTGKIEDDFIDEMIFLPNYQIMLSEVVAGIDDIELMEGITDIRRYNNGNVPKNSFFDIAERNKRLKGYDRLIAFIRQSQKERFEAYAKAIGRKHHIDVNAELLESSFKIYQHSFKGAKVELPFYGGNICYLSACEKQKYLFVNNEENLELWNSICLGEFYMVKVPGNHVTCILNEENALTLTQIIEERSV